jgi:lysophospholipid acyltransferase (LPLAT)-like uncharacterized protein
VKGLKTVLRSGAVNTALCWLGAQYIRLVWATGKWRIIGGDIPAKYRNEGKSFIVAFWHGRLLMMPYAWESDRPFHMLISDHPDGRIISRTVGYFGISTMAGSTRRGGTRALRNLLGALAAGETVGITPDGPKGPRMRASRGVVDLARLSGVPVIPGTFGCRSRRVIDSWDRFVVAKPFAGGVILWGNPIEVARDASDEEVERARRQIEDELNRISAEADRLCGLAPVEPAEPAVPESAAPSTVAREAGAREAKA